MYLPILERVGAVLFCMMPHCVLPCNRQPRVVGASGGSRERYVVVARCRATGAAWGVHAPHGTPVPVMVRRHARMRLPPEQGKGLVDSGPIIP